MTRFALIADVHGNLPALEAVLGALPPHDVLLCAGDLVGYGPWPNETVERVLDSGAVVVAGNHDLIAVGRLRDALDGLARTTMDYTRAVLDERSRATLAALPLAEPRDGVLLVHGSPESPEEYVSRRTQASRHLERAGDARVVVAGHTHRPLEVSSGGRLWANPGSVGQSRERAAHARFGLLDGATLSLHAVEYDVERTRSELRRLGLPEEAVHQPPSRVRALARALRR